MPTRILRIREVCQRTGMSRSSIYAYEQNGEFPKRIQISARAVGWVEADVEAFLQARIAASSK
jgi:prophage regulatory protein